MSFPFYVDAHLVIEKDMKIKCKDIKTIFVGTFEENLEDRHVYVNIHKSGLYKVAHRYPTFMYANMLH